MSTAVHAAWLKTPLNGLLIVASSFSSTEELLQVCCTGDALMCSSGALMKRHDKEEEGQPRVIL